MGGRCVKMKTKMRTFLVVLLIFALISALSVYILASPVDTTGETAANSPAAVSAVSAPETGDIGVGIAFAVCGATAFVTIKLTRDKNKNKI